MSDDETGDESWIRDQVESSATEEQYLEFILGLRDLLRCTHIGAEDILTAMDEAISLAVGGNVVDAKDWAERVTLGLIDPRASEDGTD